jgi:D-alanyl-D-alanine carboxypeptidase
MSYSEPARTAARRTRSTLLTPLVVASAGLIGVLAYQSLASSSFSAGSPIDMLRRDPMPSFTGVEPDQPPPGDRRGQDEHGRGHRGHPGIPLGEEDGAVPDGVPVVDDEIPAVVKLDAALLRALRRAATDAADDNVEIFVESGWRSPDYQARLLLEAISEYGSEKEAARWVATADTSAHVSGDAVDIGPSHAAAWLSEHGAEYGLCQIYRNEPWHYELRPEAIDRGCPRMYADPTQDPRMQP